MRVRSLAAVSVVVIAGVAATATLWSRSRDVESATARRSGRASAAVPLPRCALRTGDRFAFVGRASVDTSLDLARLLDGLDEDGSDGAVGLSATAPQHVAETRRFTLDLEVLQGGPDGVMLGARIRDLTGTIDGKSADVAEPGVEAPFRVRLDERCSIRAFGWRPDAPLDGARQQQSLVASLSFSLPGDGDGARYVSTGFDVTGVYRARNQLVDGALIARVLRYERIFGDSSDAASGPALRIERALQRVQLGEGAWLVDADRSLSLRFVMGATPVGAVELEASFRHAQATAPAGLARGGEWRWGHLLDQAVPMAPEMPREVDPRIARLTFDAALAEASRRMHAFGGNPADYVVLLSEWLRAHPEALPELLDRIRGDGLREQPRLRAALFHAMAAANTPATRAALQRIFTGEDFAYGRRIDAAHVMALLSPPPEGFVAALMNEATHAPDVFDRGSMQLALGMFAATQAEAHPEQAAQARAELARAIDSAKGDETSLVHGLQAAGNAASDEFFPAVSAHLDDGRAAVREAAADAMRNMSADAALPAVDERLAVEVDPAVRSRLIDSAATAIRREGREPPASLLTRVSEDAADATSSGHFGRAVAFLGIAAEAGSADARRRLESLYEAERGKGAAADATRLKTLGHHVSTRWTRR